MKIEELRKAWGQLSAGGAGTRPLSNEEIRALLVKRSRSLIERIDRNIRIGFVVIFLVIVLLIVWDLLYAPSLVYQIGNNTVVPLWLTLLDTITFSLIAALFLIFLVRYFIVRRQCDMACEMRKSLEKIIEILTFYRRLFSLALLIFLLVSATGFITGFYQAIANGSAIPGYTMLTIGVGISALAIITGGLFFLLRWLFRRMYGNYLNQLKQNLREFDELE